MQMARQDTYDPGHSNISVTQLIDSPRVLALRKIHAAERTQDISEMVWMLMGQAMHHILETAKVDGTVTEERLHIKIKGWHVSGQVDTQIIEPDGVIVGDYKTCSVWSVIYGKDSWEEQLNLYAYLIQAVKGLRVKGLQIHAICRDWRKADTFKANYPKSPLVTVDIPLWTVLRQEQFLLSRLHEHAEADTTRSLGGELPLCTPAEQWRKEPSFAVMKTGGKRAVRVFDNNDDAEQYLRDNGGMMNGVGQFVVNRPAKATRCLENYCGCADWCDQYKRENGD